MYGAFGAGISRRAMFCAAGAIALAAALPGRARAFNTTRLRFLIGSSSGYATYSRLFMKHLSRLNPELRTDVESVPEADGRLAAKRIYESGADPLVIGMFETSLLYAALLGEDDTGFDFAKFHWVGKMATDPRLLLVAKSSGFKTLEDLRASPEPVIFPTSSITSRSAVEALLLNGILGLKLKPVPGFTGADRQLAIVSGDGKALAGSYPSLRTLIEDEGAIAVLRLNEFEAPGVGADVQLLRDVSPQPVPPIVDLIELSGRLSRLIAAPPTIADDELANLRQAFDAVVAEPEFLAEAEKTELPIETLGGAEVERLIAELFARKADVAMELEKFSTCGQKLADGAAAC